MRHSAASATQRRRKREIKSVSPLSLCDAKKEKEAMRYHHPHSGPCEPPNDGEFQCMDREVPI